MWKWILGGVGLLVLTCVGGSAVLYFTGAFEKMGASFSSSAQGQATPVHIQKVARGTLVRTINAPGTIEPKTKVQISARVSSTITALPLREGASVKVGDVVARLDDVDLRALLSSARANLQGELARLEGVRAAQINAAAELSRAQKLYESKDISKTSLDTAQLNYLQAESSFRQTEQGIEIAKANIDRAQKDVDNTVLKAPIDGTIVVLNSEVGEQVLGTFNNAGSVIMEIADLSTLTLRAKVDESNIEPVHPGQNARVFVNAYPDRTLKGTVERVKVQRQLDRDGTAYFETEVLLDLNDPAQRLTLTGLTANTDIEIETLRDVIKVPSQAVLERLVDELPADIVANSGGVLDRNKKYARVVYTIKNGKAVPVPVSVGSSDLTDTVILQGLAEGTEIITGPYKALLTLKADQHVRDESAAAPGKPAKAAAKTEKKKDKDGAEAKKDEKKPADGKAAPEKK